MADSYYEFDLLIQKLGDRYKVDLIESPAGCAGAEFAVPFSPQEAGGLFRSLHASREVARGDGALPELAQARELGLRLFQSVFADQVRDCFQQSRGVAATAGLRIRLRLSQVPELVDLPWEMLVDPLTRDFLALDGRTSIVRYLPVGRPAVAMKVKPPVRLLVAMSNARRDLDVEHEWANVQKAVAPLVNVGLMHVECLWPVTWEKLHERLQRNEVHILHFVGHGHFDSSAQEGYISLEELPNGEKHVSARRLLDLLRTQQQLRLVVLNSCDGARSSTCDGARSSQSDAFAGVAQTLVAGSVPAVVAMQFPVTDDAAIAFSSAFYRELAAGKPVDLAVSGGRYEVNVRGGGDVEWATPVLYIRGDGKLFDLGSETKKRRRNPVAKASTFETEIENALGRVAVDPTVIADVVQRYHGATKYEDDPFAGFARAESHGFQLSAEVPRNKKSEGHYRVDMAIKRMDSQPYSAAVVLLMHNTFDDPVQVEQFSGEVYKDSIWCEESFALGVLVVLRSEGGTETIKLGLDLQYAKNAPKGFIS